MRRKSYLMLVGFAVAITETAALVVELGTDLEHFALGRIGKLNGSAG
jgi:hypothetical protein